MFEALLFFNDYMLKANSSIFMYFLACFYVSVAFLKMITRNKRMLHQDDIY